MRPGDQNPMGYVRGPHLPNVPITGMKLELPVRVPSRYSTMMAPLSSEAGVWVTFVQDRPRLVEGLFEREPRVVSQGTLEIAPLSATTTL